MAKDLEGKFDINQCFDIIGFQDYLKRLRTVDDSIILNLNTKVTTTSTAQDELKNIANCKDFHRQIDEAHEVRHNSINKCLAAAEAKVSQLKEAKKQNESDINVQKELKRYQSRLRMLQNEITVEQIIQNRSIKALQERCRRYVNLQS